MVNYYSTLKDEYWEHYSFIEKIRRKSTREELKIVKAILKEGVSRGDFTIKFYLEFIERFFLQEDRYLPILNISNHLERLYLISEKYRTRETV